MLCFSLGVGTLAAEAQKKEFKEVIKKEIMLQNNMNNLVVVKNVFGSITVEGYQGEKVLLEVERTISAKNTEDLELGKKELQLKVVEEEKRVILYPDAPYIEFDKEKLRYNWCNNNDDISYDHKLNFKLKVPNSVKINTSTINDGEISIKNTKGNYLEVSNINGGISLHNITGTTKLSCINGEVDISYAKNPTSDSEYHSLNGDINISYQKSLSANISFKSMNGELYTDFDINKQYSSTKKDTGNKKMGKYKYEAKPVVQIGNGGVEFNFETLNGDVIIKKI
ncbi:hypothetical protein DX873_13530 [Flagellimonas nanhaiensis]|uniref:DUF4097 domain-containing protein n=2 Tax=Flagellimonas nanhaiensis TaxID=2292706 RepID=A0A371JNB4_9FLAO|nr:hypothetical protein DX873_13530 [Allomuricauda nanhaiensis]